MIRAATGSRSARRYAAGNKAAPRRARFTVLPKQT
jgi:hypothetical protein